MKKCPFCSEEIQNEAMKCRYCGEWLDAKPTTTKAVSASLGPSLRKKINVITPPIEKNQKPQATAAWAASWALGLSVGYIIGPLIIYLVYGVDDLGGKIGMKVVTGLFLFPVIFAGLWLWRVFTKKDQTIYNSTQSNGQSSASQSSVSLPLTAKHFATASRKSLIFGSFSWKSLIIAFVIAFFINIFASAAAGIKPAKNIIWTMWWMYSTIEAWKYWKWKALLPYPIFLLTTFTTIMILVSLGMDYMSWTDLIVRAVLNIGGLIIFDMLLRNSEKAHEMNYPAASIREFEIKPAEVDKSLRRTTPLAPKKTQPNEEFIALLKSAVNENRLETIPNEDLLEICKRARSIDASSKKLDSELSRTINILLEEIKKRDTVHPIAKSPFPMKDLTEAKLSSDKQEVKTKKEQTLTNSYKSMNNIHTTEAMKSSTEPDWFSDELRRIERRTLSRIRDIYTLKSDDFSKKK